MSETNGTIKVRAFPVRQKDHEGNPEISGAPVTVDMAEGERRTLDVPGRGPVPVIAETGGFDCAFFSHRIGAKGVEVIGARIDWKAMA